MYEHVFVVTGRGAVSKKKDTFTITNQSHQRPKNPPKSAQNAAALHRTPSTGHGGRPGPQNNQKVRLTGVRLQTVCTLELLLATFRFCLCRQLTSFGTEAELYCCVWLCRGPRLKEVTNITWEPATLPLRHLRGKETWRTLKMWTANWPTSSSTRL